MAKRNSKITTQNLGNTPGLTFTEALCHLYFDIDINDNSAHNTLGKFSREKRLVVEGKASSIWSLSTSTAMQTRESAEKKIYTFRMIRSPLENMSIDAGYIRIGIGESEEERKVLDFEWCVLLSSKIDADAWFEHLKIFFGPVSTKHKYEEGDDDKLGYIRYAQFSSRTVPIGEIRDIAISLVKSLDGSYYEVRLYHYNDFME